MSVLHIYFKEELYSKMYNKSLQSIEQLTKHNGN